MEEKKNGMAIAALVLGIVSIVTAILFGAYGAFIGLACGILAIIFSTKAKKVQPSGMATAGFVLGIIGTVISGLMVAACSCLVSILSSH